MQGKVIGISGPTVTVDLPDLTLYERVTVGTSRLQGEVVRLNPSSAVVQVYEETKGLSVGEPAVREGGPLTVRFTPGLLGGIFDGLQRPLQRLGEEFGPFVRPGDVLPFVSCEKQYLFVPEKMSGDKVGEGEYLGYIEEGEFKHYIAAPRAGVIHEIKKGNICPEDAVATLEDETPVLIWQQWPIRIPRPFRRKKFPRNLLVTGQRCIDFLFPLALGGTAVMPGGFGTGKTILEQAVAKYADVDIVVYVGCGERGNEMAEMLEEFRNLIDPWTGRP
jgi:V/A-type H+-transporting ATPase subunit A